MPGVGLEYMSFYLFAGFIHRTLVREGYALNVFLFQI
jgi:hypothetical protein